MFMLLESIRSAFESIWAHGFRSLLTSLGIIIGVTSVIAVVSIVQGLSYTINEQFAGLGGNSLTIRSYTPFKKQMQGRFAKLRDDDMRVIIQRVDGISDITPVLFAQSGTQTAMSWSLNLLRRPWTTAKSFSIARRAALLSSTRCRAVASSSLQAAMRVSRTSRLDGTASIVCRVSSMMFSSSWSRIRRSRSGIIGQSMNGRRVVSTWPAGRRDER